MGIARNLARLVPNGSGLLPNANIEAVAASKLTGSVALATQVSGTLPDANAPSGSVVQVVQTFDTSQATTSSGTFGDLISVSITPTSSSNKVLVRFLAHVEMGGSSTAGIRLQRNGTNIGLGAGGQTSKIILSQGYGGVNGSNMSYEFLDSPATTSAITYKIQWSVDGNTGYYNRGVANTSGFYSDASTLTALEIAG